MEVPIEETSSDSVLQCLESSDPTTGLHRKRGKKKQEGSTTYLGRYFPLSRESDMVVICVDVERVN